MAERARGSSKRKRGGKRGKKRGVGHNSNGAVQDIPDEVRQRHLQAIEVAEAAVERARKPFKAAQTRLQAAFASARDDGVHIEGLKNARRIAKQDRLTTLSLYEETGKFLRIMEHPVATQLDLFRPPSWPEPVSANLQGYRVGIAGGSIDETTFKPGTDEFVQFRAGHEAAQQELRDRLAAN